MSSLFVQKTWYERYTVCVVPRYSCRGVNMEMKITAKGRCHEKIICKCYKTVFLPLPWLPCLITRGRVVIHFPCCLCPMCCFELNLVESMNQFPPRKAVRDWHTLPVPFFSPQPWWKLWGWWAEWFSLWGDVSLNGMNPDWMSGLQHATCWNWELPTSQPKQNPMSPCIFPYNFPYFSYR